MKWDLRHSGIGHGVVGAIVRGQRSFGRILPRNIATYTVVSPYVVKRFKKPLLAVVTALRAWVWSLTFSSFVMRLLNPIMLGYCQRYLLVSTLTCNALSAYPEPVHMHQCNRYFVIALCVFLSATYYLRWGNKNITFTAMRSAWPVYPSIMSLIITFYMQCIQKM
jgi:hypothetical protein